MAGQGYGSLPLSASAPSHSSTTLRRAEFLAFAVVGVASVLLVVTYSSLPGPVVLEASTELKSLSQLDLQIKTDEALLRAQQSVVNKAESLLVKALNKKPVATQTAQVYGDSSQGQQMAPKQTLSVPPTIGGEERPLAEAWKEGEPEKYYRVAHAIALNAPPDNDEKVQAWNDFFDGLSVETDAPKWGKTGLLSDDIENIPACSVDCDKEGTPDDKDFAFYNELTTTNERGHIVDDLDSITACIIDC